ncbi:Terminase small subunit [uncultured Caudovirales phage]|uniref:Terminase small subunit n=1 Tax=uncultured Caudovirales phage TaxID=2100421 RepID=A0A6J5LVQ1_9CAUD|nr:Terminase small subunit [uncultured Caudovirales phage]
MAKAGATKKPKGKKAPTQILEESGRLLPRKKAFAAAYVQTGQAQVAYVQAGYTGDPEKKSYELLRDPDVLQEIERLYREAELDSLVTARYVVSNIRRAADITGQVRFSTASGTLEMLDVTAHLRANQMLGQYLGIFREKIDVGDNLVKLLANLPDPAT